MRCVDPDDEAELLSKIFLVIIHTQIASEVGPQDDLAASLHSLLNVDASDRPPWITIRRHAYVADVNWEAIEGRKLSADLPKMTLASLELYYSPPIARSRSKFEVKDCLVDFECCLARRFATSGSIGVAILVIFNIISQRVLFLFPFSAFTASFSITSLLRKLKFVHAAGSACDPVSPAQVAGPLVPLRRCHQGPSRSSLFYRSFVS